MEAMRGSACVSLSLSLQHRVALLMQDYQHFVVDPATLNTQLSCLTPLHGRAKIDRWQALALSDHMPALVEELLLDHYDPAYTRSIERNFTHYGQARQIGLGRHRRRGLPARSPRRMTNTR